MIASTVWNQLVATLQNNPSLSKYVKYVYEGSRELESMDRDSLPCIMIEPVSDGEIVKDLNQFKDVNLSLDIFAFSSNNFNEFPKTIVGDNEYKGIFDINNDIRACLQSSYDLGGNVIDIKFETTLFDRIPNKYPIRGMVMPIKIMYRQNNGV